MPLTTSQAHQIAQLLGQYQDVAQIVVEIAKSPDDTATTILRRLRLSASPLAGGVFGLAALSFVYTYESVVKEEGYPPSIVGVVDLSLLGVTTNVAGTPQRATEKPEEACLRHLRNSFAHGRYQIIPTNGAAGLRVHLQDQNSSGRATFEAQCDAEYLVELAEKLLVAAHNHASQIALQMSAPVATPPSAAVALSSSAAAVALTATPPSGVGTPSPSVATPTPAAAQAHTTIQSATAGATTVDDVEVPPAGGGSLGCD